jgi:hypothetical protein
MSAMPSSVATIRRRICQREKCPHTLDFADPCAACPAGHWGRYEIRGCEQVVRPGSASPPPPKPESWPLLLRPMKLLAAPEDRGLGDIVERTVGPIGGDAFKAWHQTLFGRSCGCVERREAWNVRYPL